MDATVEYFCVQRAYAQILKVMSKYASVCVCLFVWKYGCDTVFVAGVLEMHRQIWEKIVKYSHTQTHRT